MVKKKTKKSKKSKKVKKEKYPNKKTNLFKVTYKTNVFKTNEEKVKIKKILKQPTWKKRI